MIGQRIRQLRAARGLSLDALAAEMGGLVTKQALSKYEQGKARPSPVVLTRLAEALGVKAAYLASEPGIQVEFLGYRKGPTLPRGEQAGVQGRVAEALEERVRLQGLIGDTDEPDIPVHSYRVEHIEDVEQAAIALRERWQTGTDPIANLTGVLEHRLVHVLEIDAKDKFDGISALAYDHERRPRAAALFTGSGLVGERQRLDLAHEIGHLVLQASDPVDKEQAALRFGGALLAPASALRSEVGRKRAVIGADELLLLKQQYGMSMQDLLHRIHDLAIISDVHYKQWCVEINRLQWRRGEPLPLPPEQSHWVQQTTLRAVSEGLISPDDDAMSDPSQPTASLPTIERRAFMKLPLDERRRIMAAQAERMVEHYETDTGWRELGTGDFAGEQ